MFGATSGKVKSVRLYGMKDLRVLPATHKPLAPLFSPGIPEENRINSRENGEENNYSIHAGPMTVDRARGSSSTDTKVAGAKSKDTKIPGLSNAPHRLNPLSVSS